MDDAAREAWLDEHESWPYNPRRWAHRQAFNREALVPLNDPPLTRPARSAGRVTSWEAADVAEERRDHAAAESAGIRLA